MLRSRTCLFFLKYQSSSIFPHIWKIRCNINVFVAKDTVNNTGIASEQQGNFKENLNKKTLILKIRKIHLNFLRHIRTIEGWNITNCHGVTKTKMHVRSIESHTLQSYVNG